MCALHLPKLQKIGARARSTLRRQASGFLQRQRCARRQRSRAPKFRAAGRWRRRSLSVFLEAARGWAADDGARGLSREARPTLPRSSRSSDRLHSRVLSLARRLHLRCVSSAAPRCVAYVVAPPVACVQRARLVVVSSSRAGAPHARRVGDENGAWATRARSPGEEWAARSARTSRVTQATARDARERD